jgi:organic radical activating enzyme
MIYDELTHFKNYVFVDWDISSRCNYNCYYCTPESHDGKINFPDITVAKKVVEKIEKEYSSCKEFAVYNLLGGEPTIWNDLPEFSKYIKSINNKNILQLLTNGNRTLRWWENSAPYIDKIIVSVHVAQTDIVKLVEKFNKLADKIYIDFQFAMDVAVFDQAVEDYYYAYNNLHENICLYSKPLRKVLNNTELMPYTELQIETIKKLPSKWSRSIEIFETPMVKKLNGTVVDPAVNIGKLVLSKENNWYGWACWIGIDTITINRYGNVKIGSGCNPDLVLGNINSLDFKFPLIPVKCKYTTCGCFADISTTKKLNYTGPMIL